MDNFSSDRGLRSPPAQRTDAGEGGFGKPVPAAQATAGLGAGALHCVGGGKAGSRSSRDRLGDREKARTA